MLKMLKNVKKGASVLVDTFGPGSSYRSYQKEFVIPEYKADGTKMTFVADKIAMPLLVVTAITWTIFMAYAITNS